MNRHDWGKTRTSPNRGGVFVFWHFLVYYGRTKLHSVNKNTDTSMQGGLRNNRYYFATGFFAIVVFFYCLHASTAAALSSGGIGGYPAAPDPGIQFSDAWFIYSLDVNESKEDRILLTNTSDETQTVHLYAVDSIATGDGNFSLKAQTDPQEGIGAWIKLSETTVTLAPGAQREVSFTIAIPESAAVGEHSGGIILQRAEPVDELAVGQNSASIVTRIGVRVYETVPGEMVKKIELTDFSVSKLAIPGKPSVYHVDLSAESKSNVSLEAEATLAITGWGKTKYFPNSRFKDGLYLDFSDFGNFFKGERLTNDWQLLKGQKVATNWEWPIPAFGVYTFQAIIRYEGVSGIEELQTQPITVTVIPWTELIILLIILFLLILIPLVKRLRFGTKKWKTYRVRTGDQLAELARQAGVSWKKLAKVNRLKDPVIHAGQDLLMPPSFSEQQAPVSSQPIITPASNVAPSLTITPLEPVKPVKKPRVAKRAPARKRAPAKKKPKSPVTPEAEL